MTTFLDKSTHVYFFKYLSIFIFVLFSGSVWQVSPNSSIYNYILLFFFLTITAYVLLYKNDVLKKSIRIKTTAFLILILVAVLSFLANYQAEKINFYVSLIAIITIAFCISEVISREVFYKMFCDTLFVLSVISLVYYYILNYTNININMNQLISNNGIVYNKGFLFFSLNNPVRNIGIFWEPGVYASLLLIGILFQFFLKRKMFSLQNITFIITLLSTQSTAGYTILVVIIIIRLLSINKRVINIGLILSIVLLLITVLISLFLSRFDFIQLQVFDKLFGIDVENMRIQSIFYTLDIFLNNPLFGIGFVNLNIITANSNIYFYGEHMIQTSTSAYFLGAAGIFGLSYTLFWVISIFKLRNYNYPVKILLLIIIISILNKEVHATIIVTYTLLFYLLGDGQRNINNE